MPWQEILASVTCPGKPAPWWGPEGKFYQVPVAGEFKIPRARDFDLQMKYNLPSWCDRVLWKSYPLVHVVCQSYGEWHAGRFHCPKLKGFGLSICEMGALPVALVR